MMRAKLSMIVKSRIHLSSSPLITATSLVPPTSSQLYTSSK